MTNTAIAHLLFHVYILSSIQFCSSRDFSTINLRESAWLLVRGLLKLELPPHPIIHDSLKHIQMVLYGLIYFKHNLLRSCRLFEILSDDLFTILSVCKPYSDFNQVMKKLYTKRYPSLPIQGIFLCAGGMDSISSAMCVVDGPVKRIDYIHDYLEVAYLVYDGQYEGSEPSIVVSNLNASVPRSRVIPEEVVKEVEKR